jgi:hypothetical protein
VSADRLPADRAHRAHALVDQLGRFVFGYRDYLVPAALVAVIALTRPRAAFGSARSTRPSMSSGCWWPLPARSCAWR